MIKSGESWINIDSSRGFRHTRIYPFYGEFVAQIKSEKFFKVIFSFS